MYQVLKSLQLVLISTCTVFFLSAFLIMEDTTYADHNSHTSILNNNSSCRFSSDGPVIDWDSGVKLKFSDFKADKKGSPGFAVATTSSAFGYRITDDGGEISGSVFVVFYCNKSWWNRDYMLDKVLEHEQLHFDICELYGRKLYREILTLRRTNRLSVHNINKVYSKLEKQYSNYQDRYDEETGHSTNGQQQRNWEKKVERQLAAMSSYSNYKSF